MIERPRDKQGDRYEYFTCSGRRKKEEGWRYHLARLKRTSEGEDVDVDVQ